MAKVNSIEDFKPLFDFVLLVPFHPADESVIVMPGNATVENSFFEVLAVGPGKRSDIAGRPHPMQVKVGDIVIFASAPAMKIHIKGDERAVGLVNEGNLVAIVGNVATLPRGEDPEKRTRADLKLVQEASRIRQ